VTERLSELRTQVSDLGRVLLDAKLSAPSVRPIAVGRIELIEAARSSGCPLVAVSAPAGYGKSTLLAEWASVEDRPVARVALERLDDDTARLPAVLASAYSRIDPTRPDLVAEMNGPGYRSWVARRRDWRMRLPPARGRSF
jgi:LuxR family transcriptional regulator, maltose regulon positive regulatory protein